LEPKALEFEFVEKLPKAEGLPKLLVEVFPKVEDVLVLVFPKVVPPKVLDEVLLAPKVVLVAPKVEDVFPPKPPKVFVVDDCEELLFLLLFKPKEKEGAELLLVDPKVVKA